MRFGFLRGWLGQLAAGLTVAVVMTTVLALALTHGGAPGRPGGSSSTPSPALPALATPCVSTDPAAVPGCAPAPTDSPSPSPAASPTPTAQVETAAVTPRTTPTPQTTAITGWQTQNLPSAVGPLMGLTCTDARHCWAVGEDPTLFAPAIVATTDGGVTWTSQRVPQQPASLQAVFDVSCFSSQECVAAAATSGGETTSVALTTTDGGTTWTQDALPADGQNGPTRLDCVAPSTCYLFGGDQPRGANVLDISTDAGATWTATTAPDGLCSLKQSCNLSAMRFLDARDGLMAGDRCPSPGACAGIIAATSDGGATWRTVFTGDGYISDIWCGRGASSTVDCLTAGATTLVSLDGGSTWTARTAPSGLVSITCVDPLHCTAVGSRSQPWNSPGLIPQVGVLATTSDGGGTWNTQLLPTDTSTQLDRVACVSASACWAVGGQEAKVAFAGGPPGSGPQTHALVLSRSAGNQPG